MNENKIIPIRLSHSSLSTLYDCERKFQIEKLLVNNVARDETEHTVFGKAYGVGIAAYFVTQDQDRAIFEAWLAYWPELETEKKNIPMLVQALNASFLVIDTLLMEYEVAYFDNKPAVELSFRLDITDDYYFVGHIDLVLRNRHTGIYYVLDAKTTGLKLNDLEPLYKHSGQTLGYSVALDKIVGEKQSAYGVIYLVAQLYQSLQAKVQVISFDKNLYDRLAWFMTLGMDVKRLELMEQLGVYPKRVGACLKFNRPCKYFGTCQLHSLDSPVKRVEDPIQYDFSYNLNDLIQDHLNRIEEDPSLKADIVDTITELV